jgi:hypothetical protein
MQLTTTPCLQIMNTDANLSAELLLPDALWSVDWRNLHPTVLLSTVTRFVATGRIVNSWLAKFAFNSAAIYCHKICCYRTHCDQLTGKICIQQCCYLLSQDVVARSQISVLPSTPWNQSRGLDQSRGLSNTCGCLNVCCEIVGCLIVRNWTLVFNWNMLALSMILWQLC